MLLIPHPNKKRALFVVDVQKGFITEENACVIPNIQKVIQDGGYELFVEATFHADKGSIWDRQMEWTFNYELTLPEIKALLPEEKTIVVVKTTKSVFPAALELARTLQDKGIEEVHIIGFDTNDCVLATAFDAFDKGFITYVIEEAVGSSNSEDLSQKTLALLREVEMTNHSELIKENKVLS